LANVEEMKYTYNRFCDRTMDGKIALYSVCGIPYYTKSWWTKLFSQVSGKRSHRSLPMVRAWSRVLREAG